LHSFGWDSRRYNDGSIQIRPLCAPKPMIFLAFLPVYQENQRWQRGAGHFATGELL